MAKKPTAAQRKVLEAMRDGEKLLYRFPIRMNRPPRWWLGNHTLQVATAHALNVAGWVALQDPRKHVNAHEYTLTDVGRAALQSQNKSA